MRVVLDVSAVPTRPVGAGVYVVALAAGLAARDDLDVVLACRTDDDARWRAIAPAADVRPALGSGRIARLIAEQRAGPRLAAAVHADVWHGPHYTLPLRNPVPSAVTVHDTTFFEHPEWHERSKVAFFRRMTPAALRRASAIVAVSAATARRVEALFAPRAPVLVIPHGVDHARFRPAPPGDRADCERLARLGIRPPYVASVGLLEPRKDLPVLVDAFARVAAGRGDLRLVLAGRDGWGVGAIREAIARCGVASRVQRPGWVDDDDVPALLRQAEAVAYPSRAEGFGLPALEAIACGAPLVTTRGSAMEEVVGDAALLVDPGDTGALVDALTTLLDDASVAARLRAAGPPRAAAYTWDASVARHVDAYRIACGVGVD